MQAILVYDITKKETFEKIQNYLLQEVKKNIKNKKIVLVLLLIKVIYMNKGRCKKKRQKILQEIMCIFMKKLVPIILLRLKDYLIMLF